MARRFRLLAPYELFSRDEWLLLHDGCFSRWRNEVFPWIRERYRCRMIYRGRELDFSANLWQYFGIEFERLHLFVHAVRRDQERAGDATHRILLVPTWIRSVLGQEILGHYGDWLQPDSGFHAILDRIHEWGITAAHLASALYAFVVSIALPRLDPGPRPVFWLGISVQEFPSSDGRLSFSWATQHGYLYAKDVLYFLPRRPTPEQKTYLGRIGVKYVEPHHHFRLLRPGSAITAISAAVLEFCRGLFSAGQTEALYRARFATRACVWWELARHYQVRSYFTTTSYSWPEKPEVSCMRLLGVRTVIWAYSANSLLCAIKDNSFQDLGVARSLIIADEFWVWNEAYRAWLDRRHITHDPIDSRIRIMGALMCGDNRILKLKPHQARRRLGVTGDGYFIGVFDMPTVNVEWRKKFGAGPGMLDLKSFELFFQGVLAVLDKYAHVQVLYKPKRPLDDWTRTFPEQVAALFGGRLPKELQSRINLLDVNIDPYLPIAASDVVLGMPFTSPVLVAASNGRPSAYYDPNRRVGYCPEPSLQRLTIHDEGTLLETIRSWSQDAEYDWNINLGNCRSTILRDKLKQALNNY